MRYKKRIHKLRCCVRLGMWLVEMLKKRVSELEAENARLREAIALNRAEARDEVMVR